MKNNREKKKERSLKKVKKWGRMTGESVVSVYLILRSCFPLAPWLMLLFLFVSPVILYEEMSNDRFFSSFSSERTRGVIKERGYTNYEEALRTTDTKRETTKKMVETVCQSFHHEYTNISQVIWLHRDWEDGYWNGFSLFFLFLHTKTLLLCWFYKCKVQVPSDERKESRGISWLQHLSVWHYLSLLLGISLPTRREICLFHPLRSNGGSTPAARRRSMEGGGDVSFFLPSLDDHHDEGYDMMVNKGRHIYWIKKDRRKRRKQQETSLCSKRKKTRERTWSM